MTPVYMCLLGLLATLLLRVRHRRAVSRWWRTRACPTPGCVGRLPAEPLHKGDRYVPEQCDVCEQWVKWEYSATSRSGYIRVTPPDEEVTR
ncbi:hypothetical protein MYSTI_01955 [Myxococcus stipitatus DSM 14675]|uniref:Uncharacterized protein n=1 Tax=Myxococcus stipitatus (strain DSM 14675 / JCM 12634 / Mx s8) TaxID=1278073 RepID=L7U9Z4_MYXSD|nr:hypothetical protein MYSTI_01955 [Myxococcus stipitatus DSM 14675]